jgi:hypothetical protein
MIFSFGVNSEGVMPLHAGIQWLYVFYERRWTPAFAGVTVQASGVTVQASVVTDNNLFATLDFRVRCNPHTQRIEFDEATGIRLIVGAAVFIKRRNVHVKQ